MTFLALKYMLGRPYLVVLAGIALASFLVAAAVTHFASTTPSNPTNRTPPSLGDTIRAGAAPIPELSSTTAQKLAHSHGFQALVSYTDLGFEPREITVRRGDTVRFTNNSSQDIWLASSGQRFKIYPRTSDTCGSSALDSCAPLLPQDFWEFTFDVPGEWEVVNSLDKSRAVLVRVQ